MRHRRRWLCLACYAALVLGGALAGRWSMDLVAFDVRPGNEPEVHAMVMTAAVVYILASAVPFVPGAEIGLGLIVILGSRIVLFVYVSMVLALTLAYLVGRLIPPQATAAAFAYLGLRRARELVLRAAPLDPGERVALLIERAPRRIVPFLLRHRYLTLGLAFNLPGNTLVGGGGGIALAAGMSGLYPLLPFLLTVALAVAPVPVLILVTGVVP